MWMGTSQTSDSTVINFTRFQKAEYHIKGDQGLLSFINLNSSWELFFC